MKKSPWRHIKDFFGAPLRMVLLPDESSRKLGLTSLEDERIGAVLPYIQGRLLDIGAGKNKLVQTYGNGVGVDVYDWGGGALIVPDTSQLPFESQAFDTITFVACLNHIPNRTAVLKEAHRLLKKDGRLLITMIGPVIGLVGHKIWWYSEDKERGMKKGETYGLWASEIKKLLNQEGFVITEHRRFLYKLNNLYIARKSETKSKKS